MLIAMLDGARQDAVTAPRGAPYVCPVCLDPVVLKRGQVVMAHFAHKRESCCDHGVGETAEHLRMKRAVSEWFGPQYQVELEMEVVAGRRADALVFTPRRRRLVVECQVSPIGLGELKSRTWAYNREDVPVLWVFGDGRLTERDGSEVRAPEEIRHLETPTGGGVWLGDARGRLAWGRLEEVEVRSTEWNEDGDTRDNSWRPKTHRYLYRYQASPRPPQVPEHWRLTPVVRESRSLSLITLVWHDGRRGHPITESNSPDRSIVDPWGRPLR